MKAKLYQIFKEVSEISPSPKLEGSILARIEILQKRQIRRRLSLAYFGLVSSLGAFIWTVVEFGNAFLQSDFWILLRLLATDASLVLKNWNNFLFSLLETFPAVSAAMILIPVFVLLLSFSAYFKLMNRNHYHYNYI